MRTKAKTFQELEKDIKSKIKLEENVEIVLEYEENGQTYVFSDMKDLEDGMTIKVSISSQSDSSRIFLFFSLSLSLSFFFSRASLIKRKKIFLKKIIQPKLPNFPIGIKLSSSINSQKSQSFELKLNLMKFLHNF